jgi:cysteinyl-tRNA synthetase
MRIYNTLTHKVQVFKAMEEGAVKIYSCGPTVYNFAHIGNMRAYIVTDLLKRALMHDGYKVNHVMNITDVGHLVSDANLGEDKMRLAAEHEHKSIHEIAKFYTDEFMNDVAALGLLLPDAMPKATEHINEMLALIAKLDKKKYLYKVSTGVYFDTSKFKKYGQLMGLTFDELNKYLITGARVERAAGIRNTTDFAVWRFSNPDQKEMVWEMSYGKGFPGWHIECSAMSIKYLGEHFDIHTGGVDHLPIHHTNEIAQSEAATGNKFVNYWVHTEFLQVDRKKMSKSLKNVYRLQDLLEKGYTIKAYKYFVLSAYYKSQINFTFESLQNSQNTLNGIYAFIKKLSEIPHPKKPAKINKTMIKKIYKIKDEFFKALDNNLNTPLALSKLHMLISYANKLYEKKLSKDDANLIIETLLEFDSILALDFDEHARKKEVKMEIKLLIEERERLRNKKKFAEADKIRERLKNEFGIKVEDSQRGTSLHQI